MLHSRFLWKLYAGYVALIVLATAMVGWLVASRMESETVHEIDRQLEVEALLLRDIAINAWQNGETERLRERLEALGDQIDTRLTVIRADGVVVGDSDKDPSNMDNHGTRPEVLEAAATGRGTAIRFSRTLDRHMRYLALTFELEGQQLGFVRSSMPLTNLRDRLAQLRAAVILGAVVASALALVLGFVLARRVTRPLLAMATVAEQIAQGAYGKKVPVALRDELGTLARAFNTMSEKLRDSVAEVQADQAKLAAILSSMVEGVVAVDRDERIVHLNQAAAKLLVVSPGDAMGRPIWEVTRLREVPETLAETLRCEQMVQRLVRVPGSPDRFFDLHAAPLRTGGELPAGAVLVLSDLTELRRLETIRRDFVSNVSHEFKTPVTVIRGLVETLMEDAAIETATRQRFLGKIRNQAERLTNLVTDLVSLARLESENAQPELGTIDVREPVIQAVRGLQSVSEARDLRIETELAEDPLLVRGEEETLERAVTNLLDNAIKYSPEGGRIVVRTLAREDGAVIEVEDEGLGIEPRHQERIFERFYRVDAARSRALGGTGLGLAIVKHTALALGGDVSLDSTPGKGSTFRIRLPPADPVLSSATECRSRGGSGAVIPCIGSTRNPT